MFESLGLHIKKPWQKLRNQKNPLILTSNRMPLSAINNKLHESMMIAQNFTESDRTRLKFLLSS